MRISGIFTWFPIQMVQFSSSLSPFLRGLVTSFCPCGWLGTCPLLWLSLHIFFFFSLWLTLNISFSCGWLCTFLFCGWLCTYFPGGTAFFVPWWWIIVGPLDDDEGWTPGSGMLWGGFNHYFQPFLPYSNGIWFSILTFTKKNPRTTSFGYLKSALIWLAFLGRVVLGRIGDTVRQQSAPTKGRKAKLPPVEPNQDLDSLLDSLV